MLTVSWMAAGGVTQPMVINQQLGYVEGYLACKHQPVNASTVHLVRHEHVANTNTQKIAYVIESLSPRGRFTERSPPHRTLDLLGLPAPQLRSRPRTQQHPPRRSRGERQTKSPSASNDRWLRFTASDLQHSGETPQPFTLERKRNRHHQPPTRAGDGHRRRTVRPRHASTT